MESDSVAIRDYFAKLGLSSEIADIYLALYTHGPQTLSALSRSSGVERTRIYRLLDELAGSNLIEIESNYKRGLYKAAPITNLHILINEKEQEVAALKEELGLIERVLGRNELSSPTTRVQFYHGTEGIRQMLWNGLRATTPRYSHSVRILDEQVGRPFMERWVEEFERRELREYLLVGDEFAKSWHKLPGQRIKGMEYHYLSPDTFPITFSCEVYDDVTAYFNWLHGEVFGVELYNRQIADAQRLHLRALWEKSEPAKGF
jgi:sugar-specific transcriptional regulator TrmB